MRIRLFTAALVVVLAGCSILQTSENSEKSSSDGSTSDESGGGLGDWVSGITNTGPQWSDYVPVRDGRTCTYSGTQTFDIGFEDISVRETTTTETVEYLDVREEPDGTHFTQESISERTTVLRYEDGRTEDSSLNDYAEEPTPTRLEHLLASDGALRFELEDFTFFGSVESGGLATLPPLGDFREGESYSATSTALVRRTSPESQAELEEDLQPGESAKEVRLDYTVERLPPEEIATPAGTFTDVVGVSITYGEFEFPNATDEFRREWDALQDFGFYDLGAKTTKWYARDIGLVSRETVFEVGEYVKPEATIGGVDWQEGDVLDSFPPMKLEGCDGEQFEAPSPPEPTESQYVRDTETEIAPAPPETSVEEQIGDYYRAAGAEEWGYTYDHLASESRNLFTDEEWAVANQSLWDANPLVYHIVSVSSDGSSAMTELRITGEDGSVSELAAYFVLEDGEWRNLLSDSDLDLLASAAPADETGACAGIAGCEIVDSADVDGDGVLDEVALVEPEKYSGATTSVPVRVTLADGTTLAYDAEVEHWFRDTAYHGATDFGEAAGEELVLGGTSGAHTLWFRVLTYRDGELVELPYPEGEPDAGAPYDTLWPIDSALSVHIGVECRSDVVILRAVSSIGPGGEGGFEGEETRWVLDGGEWVMVGSEPLAYSDADRASEIYGWRCGDLPRGYE